MKKIISVLLSVLMLVTIGVINPNPIVAEDEEGDKYLVNYININDYEEIELKQDSSIINQIKSTCAIVGDFNIDSIKVVCTYNDFNEQSMEEPLDDSTTLTSIIEKGKDIKFFVYFTSFKNPNFYYLTTNLDDQNITYETVYEGTDDVFIKQGINEVKGSPSMPVTFFYDKGDHSTPVDPTFNGIDNYGIKVKDIDGYSNVKQLVFSNLTDDEHEEYFSYKPEGQENPLRINVNIFDNAYEDGFNISMDFFNGESHGVDINLNDDKTILYQLEAKYDEIKNECNSGDYNPDSVKFCLFYKENGENRSSLITGETTLNDLRKDDAMIFMYYTQFKDLRLYCVPCVYEDNKITELTITPGDKDIRTRFNDLDGSENYLAFYYGDGDGNDEVAINDIEFNSQDGGSTVSAITGGPSNVRKVELKRPTNNEEEYFSYTNNDVTYKLFIHADKENEMGCHIQFFNFNGGDDFVVDNSKPILDQLQAKYAEIEKEDWFKGSIGDFDKDSVKFAYTARIDGEHRSFNLTETTTYDELRQGNKEDIGFIIYYTKLTSSQLYCVPCIYNNDGTYTYLTLHNNDRDVRRVINEEVGSDNMLVGFFYGDGSSTDTPVSPEFNNQEGGIRVITPEDATDKYANVREIHFDSVIYENEYFVYNNNTLDVNTHYNPDNCFTIHFENGTYERQSRQYSKDSIDYNKSLLQNLKEIVKDPNYKEPTFSYFDGSNEDRVTINENTSLDILNNINDIDVRWNKSKLERLFVKQAYFSMDGPVYSENQYSIELMPGNKGDYYLYYGNDDDNVPVTLDKISFDRNLISVSAATEEGFDKSQGNFVTINVKEDAPEQTTEITYKVNNKTIPVNISLPFVALYNSPTRNKQNMLDSISQTSNVEAYLILKEGNGELNIKNIYLCDEYAGNDAEMDESKYTIEKYSETNNIYKLVFNELPSTGFLKVEYSYGENTEGFINTRLGQGSHGEGTGTEVLDETYTVYDVDDLIDKLNRFKEYEKGTIILASNQEGQPFVIDENVEIKHVKPDVTHTDGSDDETQNGRDKWLKIILDCDVEIAEKANVTVTHDSKVIIKSNNLKEKRTITKNGGNATINNQGNILLKSIIVKNISDDSDVAGINQVGGSLTVNENSEISAPIGIVVNPSRDHVSIQAWGTVTGTKSYAIYTPIEESQTQKYGNFYINASNLVTNANNNIVAYIAGNGNNGSIDIGDANGQIKLVNGKLKVANNLTSTNDAISIEASDDAEIYIDLQADITSTNGIIVKEDANKNSKVKQLVIDNGTYQCDDSETYSIVLGNNPNGVDICQGDFNVKFPNDYKNSHSSWSDIDEGFYHLNDSRNGIVNVTTYQELIAAINNGNKTIKLDNGTTPFEIAYESGQNQEIVIDHPVSIDLNGNTIKGYTFKFNYVQDYAGTTKTTAICSSSGKGKLISKGSPVLITSTKAELSNITVELDNGISSNSYLVEINGLGMLNLNDSTLNGTNGIKLSAKYEQGFERNEDTLQIRNTNITVSDYVIYDNSSPNNGSSGYNMFIGQVDGNSANCDFVSENGTALHLKYFGGTIHNTNITGKQSCLTIDEGGTSTFAINEGVVLTATNGPVVYAKGRANIQTYLTSEFVSNNDSVFKIDSTSNNSFIQIHNGTFIASKSEGKHVIENSSNGFDSLVQAGRFTHDMNDFKVSTGYECITVDTSNTPYAIAKKLKTDTVGGYEVKAYSYASDDFDIDGNSLGAAIDDVTEDVSLIFNGKDETDETKKSDILSGKAEEYEIENYYDLFINAKTSSDQGDLFNELHEVDSLQKIEIKLSNDVVSKIKNNNLNVAVYHRQLDGTVELMPMVPYEIGENAKDECAYLDQDNRHICIKTYRFSTFATATTENSFLSEITAPTLANDAPTSFEYDGDNHFLDIEENVNSIPFYKLQYQNKNDDDIYENVDSCIDAGEYRLIAQLIDKDNYKWADESTEDKVVSVFAITKIAGSVNAPNVIDELVYTGEAQELIIAGSSETGKVLYSLDGNSYSEDIPTGTDAKEYTVYYKSAGDSNHNPTEAKHIEVTIAKARVNKPTSTNVDKIYTGNSQNNGYITPNGVTMSGNNTGIEVGTYTASYVPDSNHIWSDDTTEQINVVLTIDKANGSITVPTAKSLTYSGQAQALIEAGESTTGEVQYSLDGITYTTSIPTGTTAGVYTVYYKSAGDSNHDDTEEANIVVTIAKAKVTEPNVTTTSFEYDGNAHSLAIGQSDLYTISGNTLTAKGSATVTVTLRDKTNYSWANDSVEDLTFTLTVTGKVITAPTANNATFTYNGQAQNYFASAGTGYTLENNSHTIAGTYTVEAILSDKTNTVWSNGGTDDLKFTFVINKAKVNHPAEDTTSFVYTGSELTYNIVSDSKYSVSGNEQTNAGTYPVTVTLTDTNNYEWADEKTYSFVINKANGSGNVTITDWAYGSEASTPVPTSSTNGTTFVTYKYYDANKVELASTPTDAGTYYIKATFASTDNYKEYTTDYVSFKINKAKVNHPAEDTTSFVYTGSELTYNIVSDSKYSVSGNEQTNAGTYPVTVTLTDTNNYEWADSKTYSFVINKADGSVSAPTAKELIYTGQAQELVNTGSSSTGTIQYKLGATGQYSTSIPTATNAGTYDVYYKVVGDANHEDVAEESLKVTIAKMKIDVPAADTAEHIYDGDIVTYGVVSNEYYIVTNNTRKDAGSQTVSITLKDTNNTEWDGDLGTYTLEVIKADPTNYTVPTGIKVAKESKLSTVTLPSGFTWNDKDTIVNESGKHEAIYTPIDTNNYNTISNIQIDVQVIAGAKVETGEGSNTTVKSSSVETLSAQAAEIFAAESYAGLTSQQLSAIKAVGADKISVKTTIATISVPPTHEVQVAIEEIEKQVPSTYAGILAKLEIDLAVIADGTPYTLSESKSALTFTVNVNLSSLSEIENGMVRQYYVLRNHNGKVDKLPASMDDFGNLTFSSNLFSTYAIVYEDVKEDRGSSPRYHQPVTGIE